MSDHQINYNCFNEPFAVSPYKSLHWDMHGLIFETSIWLLAGSTRLLPNQHNLQHHKDTERSAGRLNRIHQMDKFNSNSQGSRVSNAKLTNVTKKQIWRKLLRKKKLCTKTCSRQGRALGFPWQAKGIRPSTRNLCLFPSNRTHWVAYNQGSPFLADAPKGRKGWADTSNPRFALRPKWAEWEVKAQAFAQQLTQEAGRRDPLRVPTPI